MKPITPVRGNLRDSAVPDDAALVRRCLRNDADSIRALVERFQADVFGLCVRLLDNRHDAEDVSQEIFLRVFRSLRRWDGQRPLRPWIMGIAVNRCRTHLSQRSRRPSLDYLHETAGTRWTTLNWSGNRVAWRNRADYRRLCDVPRAGPPVRDTHWMRPVGTIKTWLHRARTEVLTRLRPRGMVPDAQPTTG